MTIDVGTFLDAPVTRTRVPATPPARVQHQLPAGREVPLIAPGSDAWFTTISASKIAAIVGLSPYDSPYSLWAKMRGAVAREAQTTAMSRGHYLEPAVAAWFRDQHPDWTVRPAGTFIAAGNERHTCSPDRLVTHTELPDGAVDLLQIKSTTKDFDWGQPGTDEVPVDYRDQVLWEMYVVGASRCHVAVIGSFLEFAEYVVDYDPARVATLIAAADTFLDLIDNGTPPSIDSHGATFDTVRALHPTVDDDATVDIDEATARTYVEAIGAAKAATAAEKAAKTLILDALGDAKVALFDGKKLAERRPAKAGATPSLYAARTLPKFDTPADTGVTIAAPGEVEAPVTPAGATLPGAAPTPDGAGVAAPTTTAPGASETEPGEPPSPSARSDADLRADWIVGRMKAIKSAGNDKATEAVRKFWPADVPVKAPWTHQQIDAIDTLLKQVELGVDDLGFPPPDPTRPDPAEALAAARLAKEAALDAADALNPTKRRTADLDEGAGSVTTTVAADLRATVAAMTKDQKQIIVGWCGDAKRAGHPWTFTKDSNRRIADINAAAFAAVLSLMGDLGDDDTLLRFVLADLFRVELDDNWSTGNLLGCLTRREATQLTSIATRFAAGDDEIVGPLGQRLATHYAAIAAA